jgi:hypothetical protein
LHSINGIIKEIWDKNPNKTPYISVNDNIVYEKLDIKTTNAVKTLFIPITKIGWNF